MRREAAEAWEAAFIELARTKLTQMADEAGLRLSFSAERSVTDELARESYADVSTVRHFSFFSVKEAFPNWLSIEPLTKK